MPLFGKRQYDLAAAQAAPVAHSFEEQAQALGALIRQGKVGRKHSNMALRMVLPYPCLQLKDTSLVLHHTPCCEDIHGHGWSGSTTCLVTLSYTVAHSMYLASRQMKSDPFLASLHLQIRAWGLSNETAWGVMQQCMAADACGVPRPIAIQNSYSLLHRTFEADLAEVGPGLLDTIPIIPTCWLWHQGI